MYKKLLFSLLILLLLTVSVFAQSGVKIVEVFFRGTTTLDVYLLLYNQGTTPVSLEGWKIYSSGQTIIRDFDDTLSPPVMQPRQILLLRFDQDEIYDIEAIHPDINEKILVSTTSVDKLNENNDYVVITDNESVIRDAVVWSRYKTDDSIDDYFIQAINQGAWKGYPKGNSCVTPKAPARFQAAHSIMRYKAGNNLYEHNEYSYKNWIEYPIQRDTFIPTFTMPFPEYSDVPLIFEIKDTPRDFGGNLTLALKNHAEPNFYRYNLYITENPVLLSNSDLTPEVIKYERFADEITVTTLNGQLLENNKRYYILLTYTNIFGYENRHFNIQQFEYPIQQLTRAGQFLLTELVINGGDLLQDMVEIYCIDDGNNGNGMNLAGYSLGSHSNIAKILHPAAEEFRGNLKIFENSIIKTGQRVIVVFNSRQNDDRIASGNVLKTYSNITAIVGLEDMVVLYNPFGDALDAVPYARSGGTLTATRQTAFDILKNYNLWHSNHISSALDSLQMRKNSAAKRRIENDVYVRSVPGHASDWLIGQPISVGSPSVVTNEIIGKFELDKKIVRLDGNETQRKLNIELELLMPTTLTIRIYDIQSRVIKEIIRNDEYIIPSTYNFEWDGTDYKNWTVPAGIYILMIDAYNNNYGYRNKITETVVVGKRF